MYKIANSMLCIYKIHIVLFFFFFWRKDVHRKVLTERGSTHMYKLRAHYSHIKKSMESNEEQDTTPTTILDHSITVLLKVGFRHCTPNITSKSSHN